MVDATGTLRGALGLGGLLMLVGWRSCCRSEQGARTDEAAVRSVLSAPGQRQQVRRGRVVLQSRITLGAPSREYLSGYRNPRFSMLLLSR